MQVHGSGMVACKDTGRKWRCAVLATPRGCVSSHSPHSSASTLLLLKAYWCGPRHLVEGRHALADTQVGALMAEEKVRKGEVEMTEFVVVLVPLASLKNRGRTGSPGGLGDDP
jgi:hypothetical protein